VPKKPPPELELAYDCNTSPELRFVNSPAHPFCGDADLPHTSAHYLPGYRKGARHAHDLVIDDHAPTVSTLCLILNGKGYRAFGALNADEAEQQFREHAIDLLLVDHGLQGVSGGELAARLLAIRPVLVLMLSGNPELKTTPTHVDLLLPKPQPVPELLAVIERLLSGCSE
jgi:CheY-like chemotaxis protein